MSAHWGVADPAAAEGSDDLVTLAFKRAYGELEERIKLFSSLPLEALDRIQLATKLEEIGKTGR